MRRTTRCVRCWEVQQAEFCYSVHSFVQNVSIFSEGYAGTSVFTTKIKYLQKELEFSTSNFSSNLPKLVVGMKTEILVRALSWRIKYFLSSSQGKNHW